MIKQTIGAVAVAAALFAAPAQAQDHAMREGAHAPLMHRQEIGLSAEQAARLEAIHARMQAAHTEHCSRMSSADAQQKAAMQARMSEAMQRAHQEAASVLTADQRARLDSLHAAHHGGGGHAQHGAQASGGHAQHGAGHAQHGAQAGGHAGHECCDSPECCAAGTCPDKAHAAGQHGTQRRQGAQGQHGAHQHGSQGGHNH